MTPLDRGAGLGFAEVTSASGHLTSEPVRFLAGGGGAEQPVELCGDGLAYVSKRNMIGHECRIKRAEEQPPPRIGNGEGPTLPSDL